MAVGAGTTFANFNIPLQAVAQNQTVTITASYGGVTQSQSLTILAPAPTIVACPPTPGGSTAVCKIWLTGIAPAGGASVALSSSNSAVASVPSTVTIPAGANSASVPISTTPVCSDTDVAITATYNGSLAGSLKVTAPMLAGLSLNPSSIQGGSPVTGTVSLSSPACSAGVVIGLGSNSAVATVSTSAFISGGQTSRSFTINTSKVSSATAVTVTASLGSQSISQTLTVQPPPLPDLYIFTTYFVAEGDSCNGGTPVNVVAGNPYNLCVNVVNGGNAAAGQSDLHLLLNVLNSGGNTSQASDVQVPALTAHSGYIASFDIGMMYVNSTYDFNLYADYLNQVQESDKTNNFVYFEIGL